MKQFSLAFIWVIDIVLCYQILFKGSRAIGVEFTRNNSLQTAKATKEVVLSAGTIGSAKLLQLSGVGPKQELDLLKVSTTPLHSWKLILQNWTHNTKGIIGSGS